jgi:hypothetical protein
MSDSAGEHLIDRLQLALSGLRAEARAGAAALAGAEGSASDPYATVTVTSGGRLVDILFTDRIPTATPPQLSGSVMTLYGQARTIAQQHLHVLLPATARYALGEAPAQSLATIPTTPTGPGINEQMRARFAAQVAAVSEAASELARIRTTATSDTVELEVGAAGALLAVRIRSGGPRSGPEKLRQSFLDTLAEAIADARTEAGRILAEHGLPDSGRF